MSQASTSFGRVFDFVNNQSWPVIFFPILWCCVIGSHLKRDLALNDDKFLDKDLPSDKNSWKNATKLKSEFKYAENLWKSFLKRNLAIYFQKK
jgi:hypothetical protein